MRIASDVKEGFQGGGVQIVRTLENSKIYTTPRIALAIFIMLGTPRPVFTPMCVLGLAMYPVPGPGAW